VLKFFCSEPAAKTRPFENHQTRNSFLSCERVLTSFIAFIFRITLVDAKEAGLPEVDGSISNAARALQHALTTSSEKSSKVHTLVFRLIRQELATGHSCLVEIFVRLTCLQGDGNYSEPIEAAHVIAYLTWIFRATEFWHLYLESKRGCNLEA
jgi:hypothetical protein